MRKREGRSLTASNVLTNPTAKPSPSHEVFTASAANFLLWHDNMGENFVGWPLRASEYLTLSPGQAQKIIEQERQKPTLKKLYARLRAAQHNAIWEAPDFDTFIRRVENGELEFLRPQATAYQRLIQAHTARSKNGGDNSVKERKRKASKWKAEARKQLGTEERKDEARKVRRSANALAIPIQYYLRAKKIRPPKEKTLQLFIQKERKSK